jgi:kumamolisin
LKSAQSGKLRNLEPSMASPRQTISGSERNPPAGSPIGAADTGERIVVSIYLKDPPAEAGTSRQACHDARTQRLKPAIEELAAFAKDHHLTIQEQDPARRLVKLSGSVGELEAAFGTTLQHYQHQGCHFRGRTGPLSVPAPLGDKIEAVLGLDNRPAATPKLVFPRNAAAAGFFPNVIAQLYGFPATPGRGKGQSIALIELGGGFRTDDTATAFHLMNLPLPDVVAVGVSGGMNDPGEDSGADGEVALDIQVAGAAAPAAKIAVYFAPNTDQGFVDAITKAVHDSANAPSVMSISWGAPESDWTEQAVAAMNAAFADAAGFGVSVFAASGDRLAGDGVGDGQPHVDFPASSPGVVGCGGTRLSAGAGIIADEMVWNSDGNGTGGGVSALFPAPDYQGDVTLPTPGRGVPDVAADADPNTGYRIVVNGAVETIGGTSAAAPLWAGLFALLNEARGTPIGAPHALLYANANAFRDITHGDNIENGYGYAAGPGWDACTGLGSPNGAELAKLFGETGTT